MVFVFSSNIWFRCLMNVMDIIQLLCPAQPMGRLLDVLSTYFTPVINSKIFFRHAYSTRFGERTMDYPSASLAHVFGFF